MNAHAQQLQYLKDALRLTVKMGENSMAAQQLDGGISEIERLEVERDRLRQALQDISRYGGTLPSDNEMGLSCNGTWCAEQARAALAGKDCA